MLYWAFSYGVIEIETKFSFNCVIIGLYIHKFQLKHNKGVRRNIMGKRPKIHLPKTKNEKIFDMFGYLFFAGSIIFLVLVWGRLPEQVPAHYNAAGKVDRMGSKWELFLLPGISLIIFLIMLPIEKHPEIHNYPARINEENATSFYLISRQMLNQIKNICLILFSLIAFESVSIAMGWWKGFGIWFLPAVLACTLIPLIVGIIRQQKIQ